MTQIICGKQRQLLISLRDDQHLKQERRFLAGESFSSVVIDSGFDG